MKKDTLRSRYQVAKNVERKLHSIVNFSKLKFSARRELIQEDIYCSDGEGKSLKRLFFLLD